jgi:hypothetical protein
MSNVPKAPRSKPNNLFIASNSTLALVVLGVNQRTGFEA